MIKIVKIPTTAILTTVPMFGAPLPVAERDDGESHSDPGEDQADDDLARCAERLAHHEIVQRGNRESRQAPADPYRVRQPVQDGDDGADEPAERHLHPLIRPAFDRERRSQLGHQHPVGDEEQHKRDQQPGNRLRARLRGQRDALQAHNRAGGKQDEVEMPENLAQLGLFPRNQRTLGVGILRTHVDESPLA
jgi:hypothetical protein